MEKNVEYAFSAFEALDKGYRPCLRCRPDSAPGSSAWMGINTTVKRGILMIQQNLQQSVSQIAERLGISERYLHKLMTEHVGMSAKMLQIYQRILQSKALLHQTDMSIDDVADAVGFSARQLQIHFKKILKLNPRDIRKMSTPSAISNKSELNNSSTTKSPKNSSRIASTMNENTLSLAYRPPFHWRRLLAFFKRRQVDGNECVTDSEFIKTLDIDGEAVEVLMRNDESANTIKVSYANKYLHLSPRIAELVKKMLDLDCDPLLIKSQIIKSGFPDSLYIDGLRIPGIACEFEAGCRAILGQQVSLTAAIGHVNALQTELATDKRFVRPQQVASADLSFLRMPESRRLALKRYAEFYLEHSDAEIDEWLQIKGIGPWTCNYAKMRTQYSPDIFLDGDLVIKKQIQRFGDEGILFDAQNAAPYRSYLTFQMWENA